MSGMPYVRDVRDVRRVLRLVERGTMPSAVTAKHLAANGIPADDAENVRYLLEALEFVTDTGAPTSVWVGYRESDDRALVLAEALRTAYGPLVEVAATGADAVAEVATGCADVEDGRVDDVVATFLALHELSDAADASPAAPAARIARQGRAVVGDVSRLLQVSVGEFDAARVCLEHDLTRPAVVSAWSSLAALAFAHLAADDFAVLRTSGRRAAMASDELMRRVDGAELIELLVVAGLVGPDDRTQLEALLAERDDCAHPAVPAPDRDRAAAYLNSVLGQAHQLTQHPLGQSTSAPEPTATPAEPVSAP